MKTKLFLFSLLIVTFSCKKADPSKPLSVVGAEENPANGGGGGNGSPFVTGTKTVLASTSSTINDIVVTNNALYIVGSFSSFGGASSRCIVSYDGSSFGMVSNNFLSGSSLYSVYAFNNNRLLVGGIFTTSSTSGTRYFGYIPFSSSQVSSYSAVSGTIYDFEEYGTTCYMAGSISSINSASASCGYYTNSYSLGTYGAVLSSGAITKCMANFDGHLFMGGTYSTSERNIVYGTGTSWYMSGNGFNGTVNDLEVYDGKLYAAGGMSYDGSYTTPLNYVNAITSYSDTWQKAGTNNLPTGCKSLTTHGSNLIAACNSGGNVGYLYSYNTTTNSWTNCMLGSQIYYRLDKVASFNGKLYGLEKNTSSGVTYLVRYD
jgi:hypothetical protein